MAALDTSPERSRLVESIVRIAKNLGSDVIAEGVDTVAQQRALLKTGCRLRQVYLAGAAVPAPVPFAVPAEPRWRTAEAPSLPADFGSASGTWPMQAPA